MSVQETIKNIIKERNRAAEELKLEKEAIGRKISAVKELKSKCIAADTQDEYQQMIDSNPGLGDVIKKTSEMDECIVALQEASDEMDSLINRFERKTINVSAVGDSRSGKSRFMQTVSGLDDNCIPSFAGTFCTGVRSIIENREKEETTAVITLKDTAEILKEINDKLEFITDGKVRITSVDELDKLSAKYLSGEEILRADSKKNMAEGRINDFVTMYVDNKAEWCELIQDHIEPETLKKYSLQIQNMEKREFLCRDESQIQKFVAKRDAGDRNQHGANATPFYRYIAVHGAVIYAEFQLTDMNQLRLVDTVGLGDLAEGTTQKMHEVIGQESDAVIYFFCPDELKGGMIDERTAKILNYDIPTRYEKRAMDKWMAVLVNHKILDDGWDNGPQCEAFLKNFYSTAPALSRNVVFTEIIDVSDETDVREKCLQPLLSSLLNNLTEIDHVFREDAEIKRKTADEKIENLSRKFSELRIPEADDIINSNFKEMFESFILNVNDYSVKASSQTGLKDNLFDRSLEAVERLISTSRSDHPEVEAEWVTTETICGSYGYIPNVDSKRVVAFNALQSTVRGIGRTSSEELKEKEREIKEKIADIFLQQFHFERNRMPLHTDPEFFRKTAEELFGKEEAFEQMRDAFLSIDKFSLNEADGIVKLLFNDCADKYISSQKKKTDEKEENAHVEKEEKPAPSQFVFNMNKKEEHAEEEKEEKRADSGENALVQAMDESIRKFIRGVRSSDFYKLPSIVPLSRQIEEELRYFMRCFDVGYQREWAIILNRQMKKEHIFVKEKEEIDNKMYLYRQFAQTLKNCFYE